MVFRRAIEEDAGFVVDLGSDVFAMLGDYRRAMPEWFVNPGVSTWIASVAGMAVGFTMLGFYARSDGTESYVADLLAIALLPAYQSRGYGAELLTHAADLARLASRRVPVSVLQLSVAEDNARARRLFGKMGFRAISGDYGHYDGGQRVIHMELAL